MKRENAKTIPAIFLSYIDQSENRNLPKRQAYKIVNSSVIVIYIFFFQYMFMVRLSTWFCTAFAEQGVAVYRTGVEVRLTTGCTPSVLASCVKNSQRRFLPHFNMPVSAFQSLYVEKRTVPQEIQVNVAGTAFSFSKIATPQ